MLVESRAGEQYASPGGRLVYSFRGDDDQGGDLSELLRLRESFVSKMGWLPEGVVEGDEYDESPLTSHFFCRDGGGAIASTMRLTDVDPQDVGGMLSVRMLDTNREMQSEVMEALDQLALQDPYIQPYDLTRLVLKEGVGRSEAEALMLRMFVEAMNQTAPEHGLDHPESVVWMFATTSNLRRALKRIGVSCEPLATGRVSPGDTYDTDFCYIRPRQATELALSASGRRYKNAKAAIALGYRDENTPYGPSRVDEIN